MSLEDAKTQMSEQPELPLSDEGESLIARRSEWASTATDGNRRSGASGLMEKVVEPRNLQIALKRVRQNKGSCGVDGMTVEELPEHLRQEWPRIREELLGGRYEPKPVKRQTIPKSGGGTRELCIPCVLDRFIQQAILQVLQPIYDPTFSKHSHGFRPGRRAHDAVREAQEYIRSGRTWVVDVDLEKFFDRVNHDVLMSRVARRIEDKRLLKLIRRYLEAGVMLNGVVMERHEGTPQGGPLSPLLANILLDEVDKELERRGHAFVRYADDSNVYVRSKRAGERVMNHLRKLYGKLRLRVNETKSAIDRVTRRQFLGFSFWVSKGKVKKRVAKKALGAMKDQIRRRTTRVCGRSIPQVIERLREYLRGWKEYYRIADTPSVFTELDGWIRRRLRSLHLKHWRNDRTVYRELRSRGLRESEAFWVARHTRRWWRTAHGYIEIALPNRYFDELGLPRLAA